MVSFLWLLGVEGWGLMAVADPSIMIDIYSEENANKTVSWARGGWGALLTLCRSISFLEARSGRGEC